MRVLASGPTMARQRHLLILSGLKEATLLHRPYPSILRLGPTQHACQLSTEPSESTATFFSFTSGRAQRKRRRLKTLQSTRNRESAKLSETDEHELLASRQDDRTVMDILFPNPYKGEDDINKILWPKTLVGWKTALALAWREYRSSWDGFWTSKGLLVEDRPVESETSDVPMVLDETQQQALDKTQRKVTQNVRHNAVFLLKESEKLKNELQTRTGIYNKEDLRNWAADMMRLGSDCVQQFMTGYRKGRDDEVEKMLTQYFQELEVAANQPKRRRRQRRVRNRFY